MSFAAARGFRELVGMALPGGIVNGFAHARPGIERVAT
jgi:hypothetical protein